MISSVKHGFFLLFLAAAVLIFSAAGCAEKGEKPIKIGFLVNNPEQKWFQNEWKYAQECADKYGFDLITIAATDGDKVLSAIDNLAAQGAQGFVICPPDVRLGPAVIARANSHDMKVFTVDDRFVDYDGNFLDVPYMGISATKIGRSVGFALYEELTRRGWDLKETGAMTITFDELDTAYKRTDGAISALIESGFPEENIFKAPQKHTDVPMAFDAADVMLTRQPTIKRWLVCAINDEGVLGAVRALENRGFDFETVIGIGIGGGVSKSEFEKDEPTGFYATCLLNPYRHGYETTELLYKWIRDGIEPPKEIHTEGTIITRETREQVMRELHLSD
ncbi:arabinose ABC transporter substrate-binding protein [Candidatus Latescibacterota bacterium]